MLSLSHFKDFFTKGDARSVAAKRNIVALFFIKGLNILTGLLLVPLTINYISAETYGIWLTISGIVLWIGYFDLGLGNGFRNCYAKAKAKGDLDLARQYLSTTYLLLTITLTGVMVILAFINEQLNWSSLLHLNPSYAAELKTVFLILGVCFCVRLIVSTFSTMLLAEQRPALSATVQSIAQIGSLIAIYYLTLTEPGNLISLAYALSAVPCLLIFISSVIYYTLPQNRASAPRFKDIRLSLYKDILGIGIQFFLILLCMLFIFQFTNIILTRELSPIAVTQYNISYKYMGLLYMIAELVLSPFWSGYTDAYTKGDYPWMHNTLRQLEKLLLLCIPTLCLMVFLTDWVIKLWIKESVIIPLSLSIAMALFVFMQCAASVYVNLINGTGKIRLQFIIYLLCAIIAIPLMEASCRAWGVSGILAFPTFVFGVQALFGKIQLRKIVTQQAVGIWNK